MPASLLMVWCTFQEIKLFKHGYQGDPPYIKQKMCQEHHKQMIQSFNKIQWLLYMGSHLPTCSFQSTFFQLMPNFKWVKYRNKCFDLRAFQLDCANQSLTGWVMTIAKVWQHASSHYWRLSSKVYIYEFSNSSFQWYKSCMNPWRNNRDYLLYATHKIWVLADISENSHTLRVHNFVSF